MNRWQLFRDGHDFLAFPLVIVIVQSLERNAKGRFRERRNSAINMDWSKLDTDI